MLADRNAAYGAEGGGGVNVYTAPTIGPTLFGAVLSAARSPVLAERPARDYYDLIVSYGIDPAFALAVAGSEHGYATNKAAVVLRYNIFNWADCRTRRKASLGGKSIATDRGNFWAYASWYDSLDDLCYRLADPTYAYAGKRTVETIVPVLCPTGDMDNDPARYVRGVVALMAAWQAQEAASAAKGGSVAPTIIIPKPPMVIDHTPSKFGYRQGTRQQLIICDHITAAKRSTYHLDTPSLGWLRDPHLDANGDDISPSVNYLIGRSGVIVEVVPPDGPAPWTNGIDYDLYPNGKRPNMANPLIADVTRRRISPNQICITIEHEGEDGGEMTPAQWIATIALHAWLCQRFRIVPDTTHIIGHNQIDGIDRPYCPGWTEAQWTTLRGTVAKRLAQGDTATKGAIATAIGGQEDDMQLPAPGTAETRIAPDGTPYTVLNWGGKATKILGTNFADVGVSLIGADGKTEYDRSIQRGEMRGYTARPK